MIRLLSPLPLALAVFAAGPALAETAPLRPVSDLIRPFEAKGEWIRETEMDDGQLKIEVVTAEGRRLKRVLDARTGAVLREALDD